MGYWKGNLPQVGWAGWAGVGSSVGLGWGQSAHPPVWDATCPAALCA